MPACATFSGASGEAAMASSAAESASAARTERRLSRLTLLIGLIAALLVALFRDRLWGVGLAIGAVLAWLNFRWLSKGLDALVLASTAQAGNEKPAVPLLSYFGMVFRYGLIALAVYVIFVYLRVPLVSMIVGLRALGAATVAARVYEILPPADHGAYLFPVTVALAHHLRGITHFVNHYLAQPAAVLLSALLFQL